MVESPYTLKNLWCLAIVEHHKHATRENKVGDNAFTGKAEEFASRFKLNRGIKSANSRKRWNEFARDLENDAVGWNDQSSILEIAHCVDRFLVGRSETSYSAASKFLWYSANGQYSKKWTMFDTLAYKGLSPDRFKLSELNYGHPIKTNESDARKRFLRFYTTLERKDFSGFLASVDGVLGKHPIEPSRVLDKALTTLGKLGSYQKLKNISINNDLHDEKNLAAKISRRTKEHQLVKHLTQKWGLET